MPTAAAGAATVWTLEVPTVAAGITSARHSVATAPTDTDSARTWRRATIKEGGGADAVVTARMELAALAVPLAAARAAQMESTLHGGPVGAQGTEVVSHHQTTT